MLGNDVQLDSLTNYVRNVFFILGKVNKLHPIRLIYLITLLWLTRKYVIKFIIYDLRAECPTNNYL